MTLCTTHTRCKLSSKIIREQVRSVDVKECDGFNLLTGGNLKLSKRLGWLLVNGDRHYYLNSYLYPVDELEEMADAAGRESSIR